MVDGMIWSTSDQNEYPIAEINSPIKKNFVQIHVVNFLENIKIFDVKLLVENMITTRFRILRISFSLKSCISLNHSIIFVLKLVWNCIGAQWGKRCKNKNRIIKVYKYYVLTSETFGWPWFLYKLWFGPQRVLYSL